MATSTIHAYKIVGCLVDNGFSPSAVTVQGAVGNLARLMGMNFPKSQPGTYSEKLKEGGILISLRIKDPEETEQATSLFKQSGGQDITMAENARQDLIQVTD